MGQKNLRKLGVGILSACLLGAVVPAGVTLSQSVQVLAKAKSGLVKEKKGYCYYKSGKKLKGKWKTVKGKRYYFKKNGIAATGKYKVKKTFYVFDAKGRLCLPGEFKKKAFVKVKGAQYGVDAKGRMLTGTHAVNDKFYHFSANGKCDAAVTKALQSASVEGRSMEELYRLIGPPDKAEYFDEGCYRPGEGQDGVLTYKNFTIGTFKYYGTGLEVFVNVG